MHLATPASSEHRSSSSQMSEVLQLPSAQVSALPVIVLQRTWLGAHTPKQPTSGTQVCPVHGCREPKRPSLPHSRTELSEARHSMLGGVHSGRHASSSQP